MIVFTRTGAAVILHAIVERAAFLGLFTADVEPTPLMISAKDYGEVKATGYLRAELRPAEWRIGEMGLAQHAKVTFDFTTAPGKLVGYFVADVGGSVLFADRFASPHDFSEFGGRLSLIPTIRLR